MAHRCGLRYQIFLRILSVIHLILVVSNFFVVAPNVFDPLYIIYSLGIICSLILFIYSFCDYRPWFFVLTLCLQILYILAAGYFASLALMGYFTVKMAYLCLVFGTNTLVIIVDVISMIVVVAIRSETLRIRAMSRKRLRRSDVESAFGKY